MRCGSVKRAGGGKIFEAEKMWERVLEDVGDGIFVFAGGPTIFLSYLSIILPSQPLFTPIISTSSPKILLMLEGIRHWGPPLRMLMTVPCLHFAC